MNWVNIESYILTDIIDILIKINELTYGTEDDLKRIRKLCVHLSDDLSNILLDEHLCPNCGAELEYRIDKHDGHRIIHCSECRYKYE